MGHRKLPGGGVVDDQRTTPEKNMTVGFVVANDSFLSGWGPASRRSIFAVPFRGYEEAKIVEENMRARSEMKYVRVVSKNYRPHLLPGDHLSIRSMPDSKRFYTAAGFSRDLPS